MPTQNFLDQLQAAFLISSREMVNKKILKPDWLTTFQAIFLEQTFSQIWDLCKNTANNIYFHYRIYSKRPVFSPFWVNFPNFWGKFFFWEIWLSHATLYGFLAPCQNLEKTNDTIPTKHLDRWKDRWKDKQKDEQTLVYSTSYLWGSKNISE